MKHSYFHRQEKSQPFRRVVLKLSSEVCFGIFVSLSLVIAGLLYGASFRVSHTQIALPPVNNPHAVLESHVRKVVSGFPIEAMAPYIAEHKKVTAAFLVGIAKKESNWGKRIPRSEDGADCFNYWGYRGAGSRGIAMGHGCFGSREEAIDVVGTRIETLVNEYKFDTPEEFIVWKCGFSCDGHSNQSVKKWISDVKIYFNKVYN
ncbi:MAG: hypothetical protein WAV46_01000 [Candidatus Moraniibacteriota bacterium]